jgi:hypothetical protein
MGLCIGRDSDEIARALGVQPITVRKWKQDPIDGSGSRNAVDVLRITIQTALNLGRSRADALAPLRCLQEYFRDELEQHPDDLHEAYSETMHEFSRLVAEHNAALKDKRVSPLEHRRMDRIVYAIRSKLDEYEAALNATADRSEETI